MLQSTPEACLPPLNLFSLPKVAFWVPLTENVNDVEGTARLHEHYEVVCSVHSSEVTVDSSQTASTWKHWNM